MDKKEFYLKALSTGLVNNLNKIDISSSEISILQNNQHKQTIIQIINIWIPYYYTAVAYNNSLLIKYYNI